MSNTKTYTLLDAKSATGVDKISFGADFDNVVFDLSTASNADGTVKFACSNQIEPPTFTDAQSTTNQFDYIEVVDLEDGSKFDGDTGIVLTGTDDNRQLEANVNNMRWYAAIITIWTAGAWTVKSTLYKN